MPARTPDDPIAALATTIAGSPRDWSLCPRDAWLYGILCGWDDASMTEVQRLHRWTDAEVARLRRLRERLLTAQALILETP